MQNDVNGKAYAASIDLEAELRTYDVETKYNDYIGMQKKVLSVLREEGFLDNNVVTNEGTGMQIAITAKGIKETLGSGKRFQSLPRELKRLKVATLRFLPEIIKIAKLLEDDVENIHGKNTKFAYLEAPIEISGEEAVVKINVKKQILSNKFWIHNVQIEKNLGPLSPAIMQALNEHQSSNKTSEQLNPEKKQDIHELQNSSMDSIALSEENVTNQYYKLFESYNGVEAHDFQSKTGWKIELGDIDDIFSPAQVWVVYRSVEDLPEDVQRMIHYQEPREGEGYKCFYDNWIYFEDALEFQKEKSWRIAFTADYAEATDRTEEWCIVYRDITDLPKNLQERVVHAMSSEIAEYQRLLSIPEDKKVNCAEISVEQLQIVHDRAHAWLEDFSNGWLCDVDGKFIGISTNPARFIAEYEQKTNVPLEERIISSEGPQNKLQLKHDVTKEEYLLVYEKAAIYKDNEVTVKENIFMDVSDSGFKATDLLIENIRLFSELEGKNYSLKEISELYKSKPDFSKDPEKAKCFDAIVKECQEQELAKMKETTTFLKHEMQMELTPTAGA